MIILHNRATENHNISDFFGEGPYRVADFVETVSTEEIEKLKIITDHYLNKVHSPRYVRKIKKACELKSVMAEVQLTPLSFNAISASATLAIMAARNNDFAITRPPGHHALNETANGFCFFNNIAVAVSSLLEKGEKVCIIDIDGHHGNGTESIFRTEKNVFFCSIFQRHAYAYPRKNLLSKNTLNIPISPGSGDDVFLESLKSIIKEVRSFNPDTVAVSAGFDGYSEDRILDLNYSIQGYYEAGKLIASLNKPIFAVLEGGYHSKIRKCVDSLIAGFTGGSFEED